VTERWKKRAHNRHVVSGSANEGLEPFRRGLLIFRGFEFGQHLQQERFLGISGNTPFDCSPELSKRTCMVYDIGGVVDAINVVARVVACGIERLVHGDLLLPIANNYALLRETSASILSILFTADQS
jgi:hypothetical protein